ncbi:MAG: hypothetical protein AAGF24_13035, partial [Cyanobacteria bacterium P01_H01_bin.121]
YVGTGLTIFGACLAIAIVYAIFGILTQSIEIPFLDESAALMQRQLQERIADGAYMFDLVARYVTVLVLLSIAAGLAKTAIEAGAQLIQSDLQVLLEKLGEELARLWQARQPQAPPQSEYDRPG